MSSSFRAQRQAEEGKPTRYYSNRQETAVAKAVGGKKQANSGATQWQKGDVVNDKFLLECKTTTKDQKTFTMHEEWFTKNTQESLMENKEYSAVVFSFGPNKPNYYAIDETLFNTLLQYLNEEN